MGNLGTWCLCLLISQVLVLNTFESGRAGYGASLDGTVGLLQLPKAVTLLTSPSFVVALHLRFL